MTLSIELLPAPFGPMIARISCSRTSKLTCRSAPSRRRTTSEMFSSVRITSPICARRGRLAHSSCSCRSRRARERAAGPGRRRCAGRRSTMPRAAVLELHLRLDVLAMALAGVQRVDQHARTSRRRSRGAPCACASARRRPGRAPCAGSGSGGPASPRAGLRAASSALTCSTHSRISS